jgi:hypothetical protein
MGGTPDAVQHAHLVRQWSSDVVFFPHTGTLTADDREQLVARGIGIVRTASPGSSWTMTNSAESNPTPAPWLPAQQFSSAPISSRTPISSPVWDAQSTTGAGEGRPRRPDLITALGARHHETDPAFIDSAPGWWHASPHR